MRITLARRFRLATPLLAIALLFAVGAACGDDDDVDATSSSPAVSTGTSAPVRGEGRVLLATTTSTQDSGLLDELEPAFEDASGFDLQVIAVGSGAALRMGEDGDADVLLVHSPSAEEQFMSDGYGDRRLLVMHNDFVVVGPEADPAGIADASSVADAFQRIADAGAEFVSRGDDSGTHARELSLWDAAQIDPASEGWYAESGQGMGATLNIANQRQAYTLADRATFLALRDDLDLVVLSEGDARLLNIYHAITLSEETHDTDINYDGGDAFADFMVSDEAQSIIEGFGVEEFGEPLFVPDAGKTEEEVAGAG